MDVTDGKRCKRSKLPQLIQTPLKKEETTNIPQSKLEQVLHKPPLHSLLVGDEGIKHENDGTKSPRSIKKPIPIKIPTPPPPSMNMEKVGLKKSHMPLPERLNNKLSHVSTPINKNNNQDMKSLEESPHYNLRPILSDSRGSRGKYSKIPRKLGKASLLPIPQNIMRMSRQGQIVSKCPGSCAIDQHQQQRSVQIPSTPPLVKEVTVNSTDISSKGPPSRISRLPRLTSLRKMGKVSFSPQETSFDPQSPVVKVESEQRPVTTKERSTMENLNYSNNLTHPNIPSSQSDSPEIKIQITNEEESKPIEIDTEVDPVNEPTILSISSETQGVSEQVECEEEMTLVLRSASMTSLTTLLQVESQKEEEEEDEKDEEEFGSRCGENGDGQLLETDKIKRVNWKVESESESRTELSDDMERNSSLERIKVMRSRENISISINDGDERQEVESDPFCQSPLPSSWEQVGKDVGEDEQEETVLEEIKSLETLALENPFSVNPLSDLKDNLQIILSPLPLEEEEEEEVEMFLDAEKSKEIWVNTQHEETTEVPNIEPTPFMDDSLEKMSRIENTIKIPEIIHPSKSLNKFPATTSSLNELKNVELSLKAVLSNLEAMKLPLKRVSSIALDTPLRNLSVTPADISDSEKNIDATYVTSPVPCKKGREEVGITKSESFSSSLIPRPIVVKVSKSCNSKIKSSVCQSLTQSTEDFENTSGEAGLKDCNQDNFCQMMTEDESSKQSYNNHDENNNIVQFWNITSVDFETNPSPTSSTSFSLESKNSRRTVPDHVQPMTLPYCERPVDKKKFTVLVSSNYAEVLLPCDSSAQMVQQISDSIPQIPLEVEEQQLNVPEDFHFSEQLIRTDESVLMYNSGSHYEGQMHLTNISSSTVCYKVTSCFPGRYIIIPYYGVLSPRQCVSLTVASARSTRFGKIGINQFKIEAAIPQNVPEVATPYGQKLFWREVHQGQIEKSYVGSILVLNPHTPQSIRKVKNDERFKRTEFLYQNALMTTKKIRSFNQGHYDLLFYTTMMLGLAIIISYYFQVPFLLF